MIVKAGGISIEISYRRRGSDEGLSFEVYGGEDGDAPEVLRFDCFEKRPHFHYLGPTRNKLERIEKRTVPDPVKWTLTHLKKHLPSMVWKAGHRKLSKEIDPSAVARALAKAEKQIVQMAKGSDLR